MTRLDQEKVSLTTRRLIGFIAVVAALLVVCAASLAIGSRSIALTHVVAALSGREVPAADYAVIVGLRLPRTVVGLIVGAALASAGALMQAFTRNPLADPGILGVNSGSAFAITLAISIFGVSSVNGYVWFAFVGAFLATVTVYLIGTAGRAAASPVRITLAGVALGAVLAGIVSGLRLLNPQAFNAMLAWESGSFQDRGWDVITQVAPFVILGLLLSLGLTRALNAVAMGDDLAQSLGINLLRVRIAAVVAITALAGGATAIAGPIGFVGLMIPHVARWVVGPDQRWIVVYSICLGPLLVLSADIISRVIAWPGEVPVGIVTAFVGAPVLIFLARRKKVIGL